MKKIRARKPTALYKTPYWVDDTVQDVKKGKIYFISKTLGTANGLTQIELGYSAGIRWVNLDDWEAVGNGPKTAPKRSEQVADRLPNCPLETPQEADTAPSRQFIYYAQSDNKKMPERTCFSSCCAMLLKYYSPDSIDSDDEYIDKVLSIGDTAEAATQIKALQSYGLDPVYQTNWHLERLKRAVCGKTGQPIACGILHRNNYLTPDEGGHWIVVTDYNYGTGEFTVQDPASSVYDWKNGIYLSDKPGRNQKWPEDALFYRWSVNAKHGHHRDGWIMRIKTTEENSEFC